MVFGQKKEPELSPYQYVGRDVTINLDEFCETGGVPVFFAFVTFAIIFLVALTLYKKKTKMMAKLELEEHPVKSESKKSLKKREKEKEEDIICKRSACKAKWLRKLEQTFIAPFAPSSIETLASYIFFIWFIVTASFGVTRVYEGKWANHNSFEQYPFNILSFLVGCPGLDPYAVQYTKTWTEAPPAVGEENPFDNSFFDVLFSAEGIAIIFIILSVLITYFQPFEHKTAFSLMLLACLGVVMQFLNVQSKGLETAKLRAFEFFFGHHMIFGISWLCLGFYQIYRARHGWVYNSEYKSERAAGKNKAELEKAMKKARHSAHRWFGRLLAVPALSSHVAMAFAIASRNPANQARPMQFNYFMQIFYALSGLYFGVSEAVSARKEQAKVDKYEKEIEYKALKGEELEEKQKFLDQAKEFCEFHRLNHMIEMFRCWVASLAGSGSVRIAIWFLWTVGKFFEPEIRKKLDRGYCIDSAYEEGLDMGDSSTCVVPVFLNILFMGLIIEWLRYVFLFTDTVQDWEAKFTSDHKQQCLQLVKEETAQNFAGIIFQIIVFIVGVFFLELNEDKINALIWINNIYALITSLKQYAVIYVTKWGVEEQEGEKPHHTAERIVVKFLMDYVYFLEYEEFESLVPPGIVPNIGRLCRSVKAFSFHGAAMVEKKGSLLAHRELKHSFRCHEQFSIQIANVFYTLGTVPDIGRLCRSAKAFSLRGSAMVKKTGSLLAFFQLHSCNLAACKFFLSAPSLLSASKLGDF